MEQIEADALRPGGGEELDRNGREAQGNVEILHGARHRDTPFLAFGLTCRVYPAVDVQTARGARTSQSGGRPEAAAPDGPIRRAVGARAVPRSWRDPRPRRPTEPPDRRLAVEAGHGHTLIQAWAFFGPGRLPIPRPLERGVLPGLRELGYDVDTSPAPKQSTVFEGRNLRLDWRNLMDEDAARVAARELVRDRDDLIVAVEDQTIRPAMAATSDIPIVFASSADPVGDGIVSSLSHPGANVTGIGDFWGGLLAKRLELFKEVMPGLRRVLVLTDANDPRTRRLVEETRAACAKLKLQAIERRVANQFDIETVFGALKRGDVDGVTIVSPSLQSPFASLILRLAFERSLPVPIQGRNWVGQGALFSYAPDYIAVGRDAAKYVDRILKGTKPADLPVEQASRLEFVVNLKTARALGLTIPPSVLARADEVLQW